MTKPTRQKLWQSKKLAKGLCSICGREPLLSTLAGKNCLKARRKYDRKRYGSKAWKPGSAGRVPSESGKIPA